MLIKPDGLRRGLEKEIKKRLLKGTGAKIIAEKQVNQVRRELADEHYFDLAERRGEAAKRRMVAFLLSGPIVAMILEGERVVQKTREVVGGTEPISAAPGTIRRDLASDSFEEADREDRAVENLVHASGNKEEAEKEIALWFTPQEISGRQD